MVVCNINQIRKSLFRGLGISNYSDIELLYHQFYSGIERDLTERELDIISSLATSEVRHFIIQSHLKMGRFLDQAFLSTQFYETQPNEVELQEYLSSFHLFVWTWCEILVVLALTRDERQFFVS